MNIKIEKASGNDITLVVAPQANQKIIIDRNIKGNTGDAGAGVAVGGTTGQILSKLSNANYDAGWINNANGTVTSVIGTGTVNGLSLSGAVTSSGDLTLGGTLSGIANNQLTNSSISINGTAVALGGTVTTPQGTVTSVTATSPVTSTGGATPVIAIPAATTSVDGYLTSTDWDTFNSKLSAQVYPSAGIPNSTGTAWGTSYGVTGTGDVVLSDSPVFAGLINMFSCADVVLPDTQISSNFNTTGAITTTNLVTAGLLTCAGSLQLTGDATSNQNIATNQSSGNLTIGKSTATGRLDIRTPTINLPPLGAATAGSPSFSSPQFWLQSSKYVNGITYTAGFRMQSQFTVSGNVDTLLFDSGYAGDRSTVIKYSFPNTQMQVLNTNDNMGVEFMATFNTAYMGIINTSSASGVLPANSHRNFFAISRSSGAVGSITPAASGAPLFTTKLDDGSGNLIVGGDASTINSSRYLAVKHTTASTSTTTGALQVSGGAGVAGALYVGGLIFHQQASSAPPYVKGATYFDTTLNKLRVGGATGWETLTSI